MPCQYKSNMKTFLRLAVNPRSALYFLRYQLDAILSYRALILFLDCTAKLMVVGQGGAGKTSTVRSLLGQPFDANWHSTVGASLTQAKVLKKGWSRAERTRDYVVEAAVKLASLDKYMRRSRTRRHRVSSKPRKRKRWPHFRKRTRREELCPHGLQSAQSDKVEGLIARQESTIIMDRAEIIGKFDVDVLEKVRDVPMYVAIDSKGCM